MKTVEINYFTIKELKDVNSKGYDRAYENYVNSQYEHGYNWYDEAIASVKKFLQLFDCDLCDFVMGSTYRNDYRYNDNYIYLWNDEEECEDELAIEEIQGEKLKEYLQLAHGSTLEKWNECPLTGYCLDIALLEPLHEYMTGEKYQDYTLKDLIDLCMSNALNEVDADFEYQLGYDAFEENSECNDYYYDINGNLEY